MSVHGAGRSISIYFPAGDFTAALENHRAGREQGYATHGEVARLVEDLSGDGFRVRLNSVLSPAPREDRPWPGVTVRSLGARSFAEGRLTAAAVAEDEADIIIPHFPSPDLLGAVIKSGKPALAVIADSFNRNGIRSRWRRRRIMRLLDHPRLQLVSNHCEPATAQLASFGVDSGKLIAWDVPHRRNPSERAPRSLRPGTRFELGYAGSVTVDKGVSDLIEGVAVMRREGLDVRCRVAGGGRLDEMRALADRLGVGDHIDLIGPVPNDGVLQLFSEADMVAIPSRPAFGEGFPLTFFEALATRTPVVCSDHPMFRPIVEPTGGAAMYRAGDPRALADAVTGVLRDPERYARLSEAAVATWAALGNTADWRTMVTTWVREGKDAPWIRERLFRPKA